MPLTRRIPINRHELDVSIPQSDSVAIEEPLQLVVDRQPLATLMRTPGADEALALGFLFSEGLVQALTDVTSVEMGRHPTSQEVHVTLSPSARPVQAPARAFYLTSSCGVCGRAAIDSLLDLLPDLTPAQTSPAFLYSLPPKLDAAQPGFRSSGGLHAAALFNLAGELENIAEDVGRHNALDKLIGAALREGRLPLAEKVLLMTSRASFDIVQKAAMAGISTVACMGAASSLAIELSKSCGMELYWFLRPGSVNSAHSPRDAT